MEPPEGLEIRRVTHAEMFDLVRLMRAYCDFYEASPREARLVGLARTLLEDPAQGVQLLARDADATAVGFATIYWSWSTLDADRIGIMNDLYVVPEARGRGVGRALIDACRARSRERGVPKLTWATAPENETAQRLYDSTGAERSTWLEYGLPAWEREE